MLPLRKFEKNRMARFRELDLILDFGYILTDNWLGDGVGPFPLLKRPKFPKKRRPPRSKESVALGTGRYFRRKAGGPARLRSAIVVQSCFILDGFSISFPTWI